MNNLTFYRIHFIAYALALCVIGCAESYEQAEAIILDHMREAREKVRAQSDDPEERMRLVFHEPSYQRAIAHVDSILNLPPKIRYYSDSLARADSLSLAMLHRIRIGHSYYYEDTTQAVFGYLQASPWLAALSTEGEITEMRRYAETVGDALEETLSVNIARLAYEAFARAEHLAITSGDTTLFHLVDSSRAVVAHRILTMPDSVRAAFGPTAPRPPRSVPTGLIAFLAFITLSGAAGGGLWWHVRNKHQPPAPSPLPIQLSNAELALEAIWQICYSPQHLPDEAVATVGKECRDMDSQRAIFMLAGLMILGHDHNPSKAAATIRQRLLRHFTKNDCGLQTDVLLPRTRDEFKTWFAEHYNKQRPSVYIAQHP